MIKKTDILNEVFQSMMEDDKVGQKILSHVNENRENYTILEDDDNGFLVYENDSFRLIWIYVNEVERRKKIGTALLNTMKRSAENCGVLRLEVSYPFSVSSFFETNGFEKMDLSEEKNEIIHAECLLGRENIGKTVRVIIDHPYGSIHPTLADVYYPVNIGYVEQSISDMDAEFIDAYCIGVKQPLEKFDGIVVGIIYRKDENTARWIAAPAGYVVKKDELIQLLGFEEQFHDTRWIWE